MSDILKLKYKIGEIEFEVEGTADAVEQQRINFMNAVLPAAAEVMVRTQAAASNRPYIEASPQALMLNDKAGDEAEIAISQVENDLSRTSLAAFLKKFGPLTEQNFILFSAFFDEKKNGRKQFSSEDAKRYYAEARRQIPKNVSMAIHRLAESGYIMDAPKSEDAKSGNCYMLTEQGISYIDTYVPKENTGEKKVRSKVRKTTSEISEAYVHITADDLNVTAYPPIKNLSATKEQVIMAMYIVTNEGKGEWFTVDDVIHLLVTVFDVSANYDMVNGVFQRNRSMFAVENKQNNKKVLLRRLLSGAKDFAVSIIQRKQ